MCMTVFNEIVSKVLTLNPRERADMAHVLLNSLETSADFEAEWLELAESRREEVVSGSVAPVDWNEIKSFVTD